MKPLYKVIIVLVAAIVLVSALASAFNQIATSPILTKNLNTQDRDQDLPVPREIPDLNVTDPRQNHRLPEMNDTVVPPKLDNTTLPNATDSQNLTGGTNVSGTVFVDQDGNGVADPGEEQPNVGVELFDQNGTLIATTQTDENGNYTFTGIDPGKYNVSTFPGTNGNVTGGGNQTIDVGDGPVQDVDLNPLPREATNPTIDTVTDIVTSMDLVKKGVQFPVGGTVTTILGAPITGIPVMVLVAENKTTSERYFIGAGIVQNGYFMASCMIPDELKLGNYQLIARSLGNDTYKPSESDPPVKVMDESRLTIDAPARMILGSYLDLVVTLKENSSSKPVMAAEISYSIGQAEASLMGGTGTTDENGIVTSSWLMFIPGNYTISVSFEGNSDLYGTKANMTVTVLDIEVDTSPEYLVRGYDNSLYVLVHASELPVPNKTVIMYLEEYAVGIYETDNEGRFNATVPVPYYQALGTCHMTFAINSIKSCQNILTVMSMTTMLVRVDGSDVNATLLDDHNRTMLEMPLVLKKTDQTAVDIATSRVGAEFSLKADAEGDYTVLFNGTSIYVPSSAIVHYSPTGFGQGMDWLIIGALGAIAAAAMIGFLMFRRRKNTAPMEDAAAPFLPSPMTGLPTSPYALTFPQIDDGMPPVWGENEPLLFHISGGTGEVQLEVDGNGSRVDLDSGSGSYTVALQKGEHLMSVTGPLGTTAVVVQVVNYREETVRLYRSAFDAWKTKGNGIADSMTPRELQSAIERRLDRSLHGQLDVMISLFEIAQFSERPIGRPEYESMFRASDKVS